MDPRSELRGPVALMCVNCPQACERVNGQWVCVNCGPADQYDEGNLEIVSHDSRTYGNGVVSRPRWGAQEQGHQYPSPCFFETADKHESHKDWTLPDAAEQDSPSSHDQTRGGSVPTLSEVYALQGSCDSVDHGWRVVDNGPSQERAEPNKSYEPMHLYRNDEESNDEAIRSWIDETTGPGMNGRQRDIGHVLDQVAFHGLNRRDTSSMALHDMMLEISDDTDMEE